MKIYIAGQITGLDFALACSLFESAEVYLSQLGYEPLNPTKIAQVADHKTWVDYMCEDMPHVLTCDAFFMLHNWKESRGARIEHAIAVERGVPIYYHLDTIPYRADGVLTLTNVVYQQPSGSLDETIQGTIKDLKAHYET